MCMMRSLSRRIVIRHEVELINREDNEPSSECAVQSEEFTRKGNFAESEIISNRRNSSRNSFVNYSNNKVSRKLDCQTAR